MASIDAPKHDYHLVNPSPWPIIGSFSAMVMALGAVRWMHPEQFLTFIPTHSLLFWLGLGGVLYTMLAWWRDVVDESVHKGDHKPVVKLGLRYGMVLFIASEVMFFVAWFWAYFAGALFPTEAMGHVWPPHGIETFDPWHLPFMNTVILLLSGTTVTWAHHALLEGDRKGLIQGLALTVILGVFFSCVQAYEYAHAAFSFGGNEGGANFYAGAFFMATGFHGFHVFIGTVFLLVCLIRATRNHFTPERHFGFEAAAWYWHFVDVVWLFLFACIYVWGAGTTAAH
jgi:cytochrome c oxidase subunit 3